MVSVRRWTAVFAGRAIRFNCRTCAGPLTVHVLPTTTGELLAELRGAKAQIAGIEVTASGIVYAWDISGTLTAWDLATRKLLRQFKLTS